MSDYILRLDTREVTAIALRAKKRGYASLEDYVRALVSADTLVEAFRSDWHDADTSPDEIENDFREAWHDAMTGNTLPVESLWNVLDNDE